MAKRGQMDQPDSIVARQLDSFAAEAQGAFAKGLPVEQWNPPFCGDLDMRIAADGTWHYLGSPINRPELVRLFARVLRREGDRYFLVTPVEKVGIVVDDVPFLATEMTRFDAEGEPVLIFQTNMGDRVVCGAQHRLRFADSVKGGLIPYLHVRADLWAKVSRSLYYELVDLGEVRDFGREEVFGVASGGVFFPIADAMQLRDDD